MISQVPRKLGAEYQLVVSTSEEEACRRRMKRIGRESIIG
jgi:hypothetical protein